MGGRRQRGRVRKHEDELTNHLGEREVDQSARPDIIRGQRGACQMVKWPDQCLNCGFWDSVRHAFRRYHWRMQWRDILEHLGIWRPIWQREQMKKR